MESPAKGRSTPDVRVVRLTQSNEDALRLLQEYIRGGERGAAGHA